jgi:hypothetical protein
MLQASQAEAWHDLAMIRTGPSIDVPDVVATLSQAINQHEKSGTS